MYCKRCRYDLRGQVETRCPECGHTYCSSDPNSYLSENRHPLLVVARQVRKAVTFPPTLLTLGFIILMSGPLLLLPQLSSGPSLSLRGISLRNLNSIVTQWMIQRYDHPSSVPFDFAQAKNQLPPRLSAWTDQSILYARFSRTQAFRRQAWWIYALITYTALMIPICHRHLRRWRAIPWLATILIATLIVVGRNLSEIERIIQPGSQAYVNDYIYIEDPKWVVPPPSNDTRILAYEKQSWASGYRAVAFMDGRVGMLKEGDLQTRLAAQGLTLDEE